MLECRREGVPSPAPSQLLGFERPHGVVKPIDPMLQPDKEGTECAAEFAALSRLVGNEFAGEAKLKSVRFESRAQRRKLSAEALMLDAEVGEVAGQLRIGSCSDLLFEQHRTVRSCGVSVKSLITEVNVIVAGRSVIALHLHSPSAAARAPLGTH